MEAAVAECEGERVDRQYAQSLLDEATSTGALELARHHLTAVKTFVKKSVAHVEAAFELLLARLHTPHAQVRLLALRVLLFLTNHSKRAKQLFQEHVGSIIALSVGTVERPQLPRPHSFAKVMRSVAVDALTALAAANPGLFRLQRFVTHLQHKVLPYLPPIEDDPYELRLITQAGLALPQPSVPAHASVNASSAQDASDGAAAPPRRAQLTRTNLNRLTVSQFLERFEERVLKLEADVEPTLGQLGPLLAAEERERHWYRLSASQEQDVLSLGDFKDEKAAEVKAEEEDEFANVEFVEAELPMAPLPGPGSVAAESQENSALTLQETIDRFGLGSADYRLQLNIPAPQESTNTGAIHALLQDLQDALDHLEHLLDLLTLRTVLEKEVRDAHIERLYRVRARIKSTQTHAHDLGFSLQQVKPDPHSFFNDESNLIGDGGAQERPFEVNRVAKRARESSSESSVRAESEERRELQFERKRPRLIKLESLEAPKTVNAVVEERAKEIRTAALKRLKPRRAESLFGKVIDAKHSTFRNTYQHR